MRKFSFSLVSFCGAAAISLAAVPAHASEVFAGAYVHGVDTPFTLGGDPENGIDGQIGWRGDGIGRLFGKSLQPHIFGQVNSRGNTSFIAAGLSMKFGDQVYVRPGLGIAVHTGSTARFDDPSNDKIEFGSRILFEPELGVGVRVSPRVTAEASIVHLSHATIFSGQNPGIDTIGIRVNVQLP
ncbi:acyloxyacyl hydrolase [Sphingomonas sinipercae]|uniref:Acyloxyacyl hydrolase n=1 Tax=Sphingomonas sinipercae TaxID=2714944 RepID=A0A6G7ZLQ3_9SPHN|nr:acyloxyacyl hydrolase [Sphingomonas sinipercae]QIL01855.1 acyloxyacyl hydrolase [Sphingomonas sinipercae]